MQIRSGQTGSEWQTGPLQPAMHLDLVTAEEQTQVRHADHVQRVRAEQGSVEQRRDAGQQIVAAVLAVLEQLGTLTPPGDSASKRKCKGIRIVDVDDHR